MPNLNDRPTSSLRSIFILFGDKVKAVAIRGQGLLTRQCLSLAFLLGSESITKFVPDNLKKSETA